MKFGYILSPKIVFLLDQMFSGDKLMLASFVHPLNSTKIVFPNIVLRGIGYLGSFVMTRYGRVNPLVTSSPPPSSLPGTWAQYDMIS